ELGQSQQVSGATVSTWGVLDSNNNVLQAGVTIPMAVINTPPSQAGTGPSGAIATLNFPAQVQSTTYLNNFDLDWNPQGHPPPVFQVPHFDFHFYNIPTSSVFQIQPPDTAVPAANRIPAGYVYPGVDQTVPQMGTHATNPADLTGTFTKVMIAGYYGGNMIFLEPMVTQALLQQRQSFSLNVPRPAVLGVNTLYPTTFSANYDPQADAYNFVWGNFVSAS
ncbi:MAG: cytochrome C, partial [Chloroflexi bacterium]|nr:cytochrome C [Chloroflexota bacterium]